MKYFPVCLKIANKKIVVVGGGAVAERKVKSLLPYKPKIILVSPKLTDNLKAMARKGKITHVRRKYYSAVLRDAFLVYACTSDGETNKKIFKAAAKSRIMVNVCDKTELCEFISPAAIRRKKLLITVSTDGSDPSLAARFKRVIKSEFKNLWEKT